MNVTERFALVLPVGVPSLIVESYISQHVCRLCERLVPKAIGCLACLETIAYYYPEELKVFNPDQAIPANHFCLTSENDREVAQEICKQDGTDNYFVWIDEVKYNAECDLLKICFVNRDICLFTRDVYCTLETTRDKIFHSVRRIYYGPTVSDEIRWSDVLWTCSMCLCLNNASNLSCNICYAKKKTDKFSSCSSVITEPKRVKKEKKMCNKPCEQLVVKGKETCYLHTTSCRIRK